MRAQNSLMCMLGESDIHIRALRSSRKRPCRTTRMPSTIADGERFDLRESEEQALPGGSRHSDTLEREARFDPGAVFRVRSMAARQNALGSWNSCRKHPNQPLGVTESASISCAGQDRCSEHRLID